jgi:hypothetical protein
MENLNIPGNQLLNRKILGGMWIIIGIISFFADRNSLDRGAWMRIIGFCVIGVFSISPLSGSDKSQIELFDGGMKIIWLNWFRKITVLDNEIESILLAKNGVLIRRKGRKALKLELYLMNLEQKKQVYDFFTVYAREKNLIS